MSTIMLSESSESDHPGTHGRALNGYTLSTTRIIAVQALIETKKGKKQTQSPVLKLESNPEFPKLSQRDKSFARNLVSTTNRRKGQIDSLLGIVCDKYPPKCGKYSGVVQACLRLGAAQLLFLKGVKQFAAVKETVEVLKHDQFRVPDSLVKFVNAILRRIVRDGESIIENSTSPSDNVVPWLLEELKESYGVDTTEQMTHQLLEEQSHVDLSLNLTPFLDDGSRQKEIDEIIHEFTTREGEYESVEQLPNGSLRIFKGTEPLVSKWPLYNDGKWWVQDVSSTLPAIALIKTLESRHNGDISNLHVVDMCAAPGGKTSQLLSAGLDVTAVESNGKRCRRLKENLKRLKLQDRCNVIVSNGQDWSGGDGDAGISGILVDVPCSATGTGRSNPDVLRKDNNMGELLQIQEVLADHCATNLLDSGGVMIYATCSLLKRESEDQVKKLTEKGLVETLPFRAGEIAGFNDAIDENGWLRVLPGVLEGPLKSCDGFFVARLVKV